MTTANLKQRFTIMEQFQCMLLTLLLTATPSVMAENVVGLTENMPWVEIEHHGTPVRIERIQDTQNKLVDDFSKTSRPCPPFCIHPMQAADGVETIGEVELIEFLQTEVKAQTGLLVDARMTTWYDSETIPGAVNIPFVIFTSASDKRDRILELLGAVRKDDGTFDFTNVVSMSLFCNGPWCDQSPRAIKALIEAGYPRDRLKYYRGGMQMWKMFGLTTVLPTSHAVEE